jgi:DNA-directed RNA polymerase specialized sigma24 family protein
MTDDDLRSDLDLDEREIEALFARFRIPVEDAQRILDEVILALVTRREQIRSPRIWVQRTLKRRCVSWWRRRLRGFHRVFDRGVREVLTSPGISEDERDVIRGELRRWTAALAPRCRRLLRRRYGLSEDVEVMGSGAEGVPPRELLRCLAALMRRIRTQSS